MNNVPHPGRSPDFLSRLHDGDLTAAERVQFESHRAHCGECRNAAAEFESALALLRSSRPRPPAPDLSARILRKLRSVQPRRSPLGVSFGIDLRWAGAFAAALIAVVIGSEVVMRREAAERRLASRQAPISVVMEEERQAPGAARDQAAAGVKENERKAPPPAAGVEGNARRPQNGPLESPAPASRGGAAFAPAPPAPRELDKDASRKDADNLPAAAAPPPEAKPQAQAPARSAAQSRPKTESGFAQQLQERAGGEGSATSKLATDSVSPAPRLELTAIDGAGSVPALTNAEGIEVPAELKGREFVLVVDASGRVREVRPSEPALRKKRLRQEADREASVADAKAPRVLLELRFRPGDRPRLLRVRVE